MSLSKNDVLPTFDTILLTRRGRLLTITLNLPEMLNGVNGQMHAELPDAIHFAANDEHSDVIVLTGAGRAFSAGGDIKNINPHAAQDHDKLDGELRLAKRIIFAILDMEKPLICRMNGHAIGLGATLALFCDVVFAAETARIGDPHVAVGLVAGDGGAVIWPQLVGFHRAKEFLMTGELLTAKRACEIGLVNYCLPADELDAAVDAFCDRLLAGATQAIRWTKVLINMELKRIATATMDAGLAYEGIAVRSADYREGVTAIQEKRKPVFARAAAEREAEGKSE
jgi:enoyl-CoA hydratase/carnithine racemase